MSYILTFLVGAIGGAVAATIYQKKISATAAKFSADAKAVETKVEAVKDALK